MNGIITFHDGINFGAYLQVYAFHNYLAKLGIDNEIINYKNRRHWFNEYKCFLRTKNPCLLYSNIIKICKFKKEQKKIKKTKFFRNVELFNHRDYETIFFGSDEIWNFRIPLFGEDLFYFGKGLSSKRFVAYAVSFGDLNAETEIPKRISSLLDRFNAISVRDENSSMIFKKNFNIKPEITLDPTMLYDFSGEEKECPFGDFIMVYGSGFDRAVQKAIREYAMSQNKKLISVGYRNKFCDINKIGIGPFEFLGYCKRADKIITSMFHGVLFSIKYKKNFAVIIDPYRVNKMSLLKMLGLEDRIYKGGYSLDAIFRKEIDYCRAETILEKEKEKSREFILHSIGL